jgi:predicted membrane protein
MDRFLSSFEPAGLVSRDGAFVSPNYDRSSRRLDLVISTAVGDVTVEWVDQ